VSARIVLVSGPVGAGKTTVAKLLVERWSAPVAHLEGDRFWPFFARPAPAASPAEARRRDGKILVQALLASAARFARGGYDVVADFTIGPWALDHVVAAVRDIALDFVALCPGLAACTARIASRDRTGYEPYAELHAAFDDLGRYEAHAIRDDRADPDALASRILTRLAAGELRVGVR
jgi:predicted kinase